MIKENLIVRIVKTSNGEQLQIGDYGLIKYNLCISASHIQIFDDRENDHSLKRFGANRPATIGSGK